MAEQKNPIAEAKRYLANAKEILRDKAIKDGDYYTDSKYVKMAGHTLWTGCLLALTYALQIKPKKGQRIDIKDFQEAAAKRNQKLLVMVNSGYNTMHLYMSYDGERSYNLSQGGIKTANDIIDWCEANAPTPLNGTKTKPKSKKTTHK